MSQHDSDKTENVSVRGATIAFTVTSIVAVATMVLAMIWNHNGGL